MPDPPTEPFFDPDVDEWSWGSALLWQLHPHGSPDPAWIDGCIWPPPSGAEPGLEIKTNDGQVILDLQRRSDVEALVSLLSAAADICFPPESEA